MKSDKLTVYQSQFFAWELTRQASGDSIEFLGLPMAEPEPVPAPELKRKKQKQSTLGQAALFGDDE